MKLKTQSYKTNELERVKQMLEETDLDSPKKNYILERVMDALFDLDRLARSNKALFQTLRIIILLCGVAIPTVAGMAVFTDNLGTIVTVISLVSTISFGVLMGFRNKIIWQHHRTTFELCKCELYRYLNLSASYRNESNSHLQSFNNFVIEIENLFENEIYNYFKQLNGDYSDISESG